MYVLSCDFQLSLMPCGSPPSRPTRPFLEEGPLTCNGVEWHVLTTEHFFYLLRSSQTLNPHPPPLPGLCVGMGMGMISQVFE